MGPREGVLPFFASLGFAPPPRKGAADFLQARTFCLVRAAATLRSSRSRCNSP